MVSNSKSLKISNFNFPALIMILLSSCLPSSGQSVQTLRPISLLIGGQSIACSPPALTDGKDVFAPITVLSAVGVRGKLDKQGDAVEITYGTPAKKIEIGLARPQGSPMIPISALAQLLDGRLIIGKLDSSGKPLPQSSPSTASLLARLLDVQLSQGALRFHTSFPVPYQVNMLTENGIRTGYIDCLGVYVPGSLLKEAFSCDDLDATELRVGQFQYDVARLAVNLAPDLSMRQGTGIVDSEDSGLVVLWKRKPPAIASRVAVAAPTVQSPGTSLNTMTSTSSQTDTATAASSAAVATSVTANGVVNVTRISFEPDSDKVAYLHIYVSGKVHPSVTYMNGGNLEVTIPNSQLALIDASQSGQTLNHPILTSLQAQNLTQTPPAVQIILDSPRFDGFTLDSHQGEIVLEMRLPRNATGALSDKLIVLDPGHGGVDTGATAGGYDEKNITLAIALKLRHVLEDAGARVVMTRDREKTVKLSDRPALANSIHADFFISIHNDACSHPGTASGTSTYFHNDESSSRALANCIQQSVIAVTDLPSRGAHSDSVLYQHGLEVLRESRMPAILIEVAFIDNPIDRSKLITSDFQEKVAEAIYRGLRTYIEGQPQSALAYPIPSGG